MQGSGGSGAVSLWGWTAIGSRGRGLGEGSLNTQLFRVLTKWKRARVTQAPLSMSIWLSLESLVWNSFGPQEGVPHPVQGSKRDDHKWISWADNHSKGSCIILQGQAQNKNNLSLIFLLNRVHITLRRSLLTLKELGVSPMGLHFLKDVLKDTSSLRH